MANIFIGTGGTGGHIFPAQSLAENLAKNHRVIIFGDKNYAKYIKPQQKFYSKIIQTSQIQKSPIKLITALFKISLGTLQSLYYIASKRPSAIITFGGYATFPLLIAAVITKRKIILHEQNAHLGKVNRIFIRFAQSLATSFPNTSGINQKYHHKTIFIGNLVRQEIIKLHETEYELPKITKEKKTPRDNKTMGYNVLLASDFDEDVQQTIKEKNLFNILVIGGSGGAQIFSKVLPKAFFNLGEEVKNNIRIIQQCRSDLLEETYNEYQQYNLNTVLASFFDNMPQLISQTHLVIARAGSSSIAEFCAAKIPMILIPFAKSADDHQKKNANFLKSENAAIVLSEKNFNINNATKIITDLITSKTKLKELSKNAGKLAKITACEDLTKIVEKIICQKKSL